MTTCAFLGNTRLDWRRASSNSKRQNPSIFSSCTELWVWSEYFEFQKLLYKRFWEFLNPLLLLLCGFYVFGSCSTPKRQNPLIFWNLIGNNCLNLLLSKVISPVQGFSFWVCCWLLTPCWFWNYVEIVRVLPSAGGKSSTHQGETSFVFLHENRNAVNKFIGHNCDHPYITFYNDAHSISSHHCTPYSHTSMHRTLTHTAHTHKGDKIIHWRTCTPCDVIDNKHTYIYLQTNTTWRAR